MAATLRMPYSILHQISRPPAESTARSEIRAAVVEHAEGWDGIPVVSRPKRVQRAWRPAAVHSVAPQRVEPAYEPSRWTGEITAQQLEEEFLFGDLPTWGAGRGAAARACCDCGAIVRSSPRMCPSCGCPEFDAFD